MITLATYKSIHDDTPLKKALQYILNYLYTFVREKILAWKLFSSYV